MLESLFLSLLVNVAMCRVARVSRTSEGYKEKKLWNISKVLNHLKHEEPMGGDKANLRVYWWNYSLKTIEAKMK